MSDDSEFLHKEPCPECGSRDNLARYSDGHAYCFGCEYYEPAEGEEGHQTSSRLKPEFLRGQYKPLAKRHITEETCRKFGYRVAKIDGETLQVADYWDPEGTSVVAQKIRGKDKQFSVRGKMREAGLFGQHLWPSKGRMVVITEGEIDALTVSQLQSNKWPVVSLQNGASSAKKSIARQIDWLSQFDKVVLFFDSDEPGREAAAAAAQALPPGKAFVAHLDGFKDPNEAFVAGHGDKVIKAMWDAREYRPDGIVSIADIREDALREVEQGLPWLFETLSRVTYGRRFKEIYAIGAGTGVGKTDLFTQQIAFDVQKLGERVGVIYLEQPVSETAKRIAGKMVGKQFHIPGGNWTTEELSAAIDQLDGKVFLYDHFGETDWDVVKNHIRFMAVSLGIRLIYLDHLTAMADPSAERESLEQIMKEMAGIAQELGIVIHFISHLATPDGKPHEEGGRVTIRHFKGSRAIGFWSYYMIGLERDQQADDPDDRKTTTLRVLKDRYTGRATGTCILLGYDEDTGMLFEKSDMSATDLGFEDQDDDAQEEAF